MQAEYQGVRLLGMTIEHVQDFRTGKGKNAAIYAALAKRFNMVDVVRPELTNLEKWLNRALHFNPDRQQWSAHNHVNTWAFERRTRHAARLLREWQGRYDVLFQVHTIFSPGHDPRKTKVVLHTDNTYQLSERAYPAWANLRGRERNEWVQREGDVYRSAAFLFPRSEFLRQSLINDYGCDPQRVIVVGGGGNYPLADISTKRYDQQTALFVGYDFKRKGGEVLLDAWTIVRKRLPKARLQIVGPPKTRDLAGVEWLGSITDRQKLAKTYHEASLFVMPSIFEPWGFVYYEAMAFGVPCIGSDYGATPEVISHDVTGTLVPRNEPEALAEALVQLLSNPERAAAMGRAAQYEMQQGKSWDAVAERMAPFIVQAATGTAPTH